MGREVIRSMGRQYISKKNSLCSGNQVRSMHLTSKTSIVNQDAT